MSSNPSRWDCCHCRFQGHLGTCRIRQDCTVQRQMNTDAGRKDPSRAACVALRVLICRRRRRTAEPCCVLQLGRITLRFSAVKRSARGTVLTLLFSHRSTFAKGLVDMPSSDSEANEESAYTTRLDKTDERRLSLTPAACKPSIKHGRRNGADKTAAEPCSEDTRLNLAPSHAYGK